MTAAPSNDAPAAWERAELIRRSRASGADTLPDRLPTASGRSWFYPEGQYEAGALLRIIGEGRRAVRHVDYAENIGGTAGSATFRATVPSRGEGVAAGMGAAFTTLTTGDAIVRADGVTIPLPRGREVLIPPLAAGTAVEIVVATPDDAVPPGAALPAQGWRWETSLDGVTWSRVAPRPGDDVPPHERGEPTVQLALTAASAVSSASSSLSSSLSSAASSLSASSLSASLSASYALDAPVLGRVQIVAAQLPVLSTGESEAEAEAGADAAESRCDLTETAPGVYISVHALGFRYASVTGVDVDSVTVHASVRPAPRRGAFLTDDPTLNAIWATSAYTLRLCMQTMLLDGIKRDRMPWMGDHALGVLTNAAAFADAEIVRTTLRALGRPRDGYVNGISDYSLWWVISHGLYQRHFGDESFARAEADHVHAFVTDLAAYADADGVFRPRRVDGSFPHAGPGALFLDWGVEFREDAAPTAVQMLWYWALSSAASVLAVAGHPGAAQWATAAAALRSVLVARAWHPESGLWSEYLDDPDCASAYPNFLAVLAGLDVAGGAEAVALISRSSSGTPFMRAFALMALGRSGERVAAVAEVRRLWSGMLDAGATTFWEDFGDDGSDLQMYGRPFGKSLCHGWSAGPAALLPELVLGIRPLSDGWRRFTVDPCLGTLGWAAAVTPTPYGDIVVDARADEVRVDVPAGTTLVFGAAEHPGPTVARVSIRRRE